MNKTSRFTTIILISIAAIAFSSCREEHNSTLKVVSFNIRQSGANDGDNNWELRKTASVAMIETIAPDIFGLQEARRDQVDYLAENCPEYGYYGVGRDDGKDAGEFMAIFYRKDRIELLDSLTIWLSETPSVPSKGWDAACRRTATFTHLRHKETGKCFHYINTHLDHKGLQAQNNGLRMIASKVDSISLTGEPVILTGDMNMVADNPALAVIDSLMLNARFTAAQTDTIASFNAWRKPLAEAALGDNLKVAPQSSLTIDYIFYKGIDVCESFRTITEEFAGIPFISDHYPVMALFEL